jgi:heme O synthase-like polyprenyltransferase
MGMAGGWYFAAALVLGLLFLAASLRLIGAPADPARARTLFRLSLVYLPAVLLLLTTA